MKHEPTGTGTYRKLAEKYKGSYIVIELLPGDRYRIADVPETQRSQRFYEGVAARDVLKRCQPISDAQESDDSSMESDDDGNHVSERVSRCGKAEYCARSDSANDSASSAEEEQAETQDTKVTRRGRRVQVPRKYLD
ncbi:hypothetical protein Trydic_g8339 [Trypoxylus dichotomus]